MRSWRCAGRGEALSADPWVNCRSANPTSTRTRIARLQTSSPSEEAGDSKDMFFAISCFSFLHHPISVTSGLMVAQSPSRVEWSTRRTARCSLARFKTQDRATAQAGCHRVVLKLSILHIFFLARKVGGYQPALPFWAAAGNHRILVVINIHAGVNAIKPMWRSEPKG